MVLSEKWIKKAFKLWEDEKKDEAKEEVFKFRMRYYHKLERIEDKIFLDYRMAFHEYLDGNTDLANIYFGYLEETYKDEYVMKSCEYDYYRYRWLYVNNNEKTLSEKEKTNEMLKICNYYNSIGNNKMFKVAYANIFTFEKDEDKVLEILEYIMMNDNYFKINFLNSILKDCEKISHNLYIKALDIVNKYNINIQVV